MADEEAVLSERVSGALSSVAMMLLLIIVVSIVLQVILNNLNRSISALSSYARLMNIWLVFLGMTGATVANAHFQVDYFYDRYPSSIQRIIDVMVPLLCGSVLLYLFFSSLQGAQLFRDTTVPGGNYSFSYLYLAVFVGLLPPIMIYTRSFLDEVRS